ncbi:pentapeptide repeat-containing protein [Bradyrhizobium sp.]|jgi:uncharacterized protein YjbI with pentapeptide repeats|uniref:pentapeptide repeat-containing protein n=1 Tax=Bradyrhizobium sp. TaxID=376 RepID=UPI003C28EEC5
MTKKQRAREYWYRRGSIDAEEGGDRHAPPHSGFLDHLFSGDQSDTESRNAYREGFASGRAQRKFDVQGAYLRRTDLSLANLEGANLSNADFSNANLRGANFKDTNLTGTVLKGADLTDARNLTPSQLRTAVLDETTKLPGEFSLEDFLRDQG